MAASRDAVVTTIPLVVAEGDTDANNELHIIVTHNQYKKKYQLVGWPRRNEGGMLRLVMGHGRSNDIAPASRMDRKRLDEMAARYREQIEAKEGEAWEFVRSIVMQDGLQIETPKRAFTPVIDAPSKVHARIESLDRDDLEKVIAEIALHLWGDASETADTPGLFWNPDKEWDAETVEAISSVLDGFGISPHKCDCVWEATSSDESNDATV